MVIREFRSSSLLVGYTTFPKHSLSSCIPEARIPCRRSSPGVCPGIALQLCVGPLPNTSLIEQGHLAHVLELGPGEKYCNYWFFLPFSTQHHLFFIPHIYDYKHYHSFCFIFCFLSI